EVKQRRSAAAKKDCARLQFSRHELEFTDQRLDVALNQLTAGSFGIERAVGAFVRAKRHVNIEAGYRFKRHGCGFVPSGIGLKLDAPSVQSLAIHIAKIRANGDAGQ